jgi:hypothetical protein
MSWYTLANKCFTPVRMDILGRATKSDLRQYNEQYSVEMVGGASIGSSSTLA